MQLGRDAVRQPVHSQSGDRATSTASASSASPGSSTWACRSATTSARACARTSRSTNLVQPLLRRLDARAWSRGVPAQQHRLRLPVEHVLHQQLLQRHRARTTSPPTACRSTRTSRTRSCRRTPTRRRSGYAVPLNVVLCRCRSSCEAAAAPRGRGVRCAARRALRRGDVHARARRAAPGIVHAYRVRARRDARTAGRRARPGAAARRRRSVERSALDPAMAARAHARSGERARWQRRGAESIRRARLQRRLLP